jgi:hypothetical protein
MSAGGARLSAQVPGRGGVMGIAVTVVTVIVLVVAGIVAVVCIDRDGRLW